MNISVKVSGEFTIHNITTGDSYIVNNVLTQHGFHQLLFNDNEKSTLGKMNGRDVRDVFNIVEVGKSNIKQTKSDESLKDKISGIQMKRISATADISNNIQTFNFIFNSQKLIEDIEISEIATSQFAFRKIINRATSSKPIKFSKDNIIQISYKMTVSYPLEAFNIALPLGYNLKELTRNNTAQLQMPTQIKQFNVPRKWRLFSYSRLSFHNVIGDASTLEYGTSTINTTTEVYPENIKNDLDLIDLDYISPTQTLRMKYVAKKGADPRKGSALVLKSSRSGQSDIRDNIGMSPFWLMRYGTSFMQNLNNVKDVNSFTVDISVTFQQ